MFAKMFATFGRLRDEGINTKKARLNTRLEYDNCSLPDVYHSISGTGASHRLRWASKESGLTGVALIRSLDKITLNCLLSAWIMQAKAMGTG